jgi:glutaminase
MLDIYFRLCCLEGTVMELGQLGRVLAFPEGKTQLSHRALTLEQMQICGLYEESTSWHAQTGIPAKSGVSGVVLGIFPDKGAVGVISPLLAPGGNSRLGLEILRRFAEV